MLKAYEYRLYPTESQKILLAKHFGCARWVYNYTLALKSKVYKESAKSISCYEISGMITKMKDVEETKWLKEVNSQSLQAPLQNLDKAFTAFFKNKFGYPKFKCKNGRQSFQCPQNVTVGNGKIYLPKFREGIEIVQHRKFVGEIKTTTVKMTPARKYFVSILVDNKEELPETIEPTKEKTLGIDVGLKNFYVDSSGKEVPNPRLLDKYEDKICRAQKSLSRKVKGGKNYDKARVKLARFHEKLANGRKDFLHKITRNIADNQSYTSVAVEDLNIAGMMKNHKLAKGIGDVSWSEFYRMLEYKCSWVGKNFLKIGRFEPSSKMCSCGKINNNLQLKDRVWTCVCGNVNQRDLLAAQNIRDFAIAKYEKEKREEYGSLVKISSGLKDSGKKGRAGLARTPASARTKKKSVEIGGFRFERVSNDSSKSVPVVEAETIIESKLNLV